MDANSDKTYDAEGLRRAGRGRVFDSIIDTMGDTPLVRLPRLTAALQPKGEVLAKLESVSYTHLTLPTNREV